MRVHTTVVKLVEPSYIFGEDIQLKPSTDKPYTKCSVLTEDREFFVENGEMPEGFYP